MPTKLHATLRAVAAWRRDYVDEVNRVRSGFVSRRGEGLAFPHIIRPVSFLITPAVLRAGISANQLTCIGGIVGGLSLLSLALGSSFMWTVGAALFALQMIMDALDGNVARAQNSVSYLGKFLDGAVDTFVVSLMPISIGVGLSIADDHILWLILGASVSLVVLFAFYFMTRFSFHREWLRADSLQGRVPPGQTVELDPRRDRLSIPGSMMSDYLFLGLFLAIVPMLRPYFLIGLASIMVCWSVLMLWNHYWAATKILNVHRRSRHAAGQGSTDERSVGP